MINKLKAHCFGIDCNVFLFLVSIAETTGMNMSVENNMLHPPLPNKLKGTEVGKEV